ncbi:MAG: KOW domain-containing RNA-binding protein [Clostridiales bacterium]|jgi:ribosomal protein L14E/L6E/L27E|nr:KOW domain-containing RNA-binding protein [Clostridiales bacterium]
MNQDENNPAPVRLGQVVKSKNGRDAGKYFLVYALADDGYVALADGRYRKTAAPKRKKTKHVEVLPEIKEGIAEKLKNHQKVFDSEISSALKIYTKGESPQITSREN